MSEEIKPAPKPRIGLGCLVNHPQFGHGRVVDYESGRYVVLFQGGEARQVSFTFAGMTPLKTAGDPELDFIKLAVREVLEDHGWLEADLEMAPRWVGGTIQLIPGKEGSQPKEIPIEIFFKKIIGVREKLRVLEQKINNSPSLSPGEKLDMQGYLTRCYGSLTTFNVLFGSKHSWFVGQRSDE